MNLFKIIFIISILLWYGLIYRFLPAKIGVFTFTVQVMTTLAYLVVTFNIAQKSAYIAFMTFIFLFTPLLWYMKIWRRAE